MNVYSNGDSGTYSTLKNKKTTSPQAWTRPCRESGGGKRQAPSWQVRSRARSRAAKTSLLAMVGVTGGVGVWWEGWEMSRVASGVTHFDGRVKLTTQTQMYVGPAFGGNTPDMFQAQIKSWTHDPGLFKSRLSCWLSASWWMVINWTRWPMTPQYLWFH